MVYFAGSPDGQSSAHDHEAEKIARRAREFALARWRWQDMQSYMLLMILEASLGRTLVVSRSDLSLSINECSRPIEGRWIS